MEFANKEYLLALLLIIPYILWYAMYRKKTEPTMRMSDTFAFRYAPRSWRITLMPVLPLLRIAAFVALVLALLYVSLEWNSTSDETAFNPIDFDELVHESELVPMSNEQIVTELQEKQQSQPSEQLRIVDDDIELQQPEPQHEGQEENNQR